MTHDFRIQNIRVELCVVCDHGLRTWTYKFHEFTEYFRKRTTFREGTFVCDTVNLRGVLTNRKIIRSNDCIKSLNETTPLGKSSSAQTDCATRIKVRKCFLCNSFDSSSCW